MNYRGEEISAMSDDKLMYHIGNSYYTIYDTEHFTPNDSLCFEDMLGEAEKRGYGVELTDEGTLTIVASNGQEVLFLEKN